VPVATLDLLGERRDGIESEEGHHRSRSPKTLPALKVEDRTGF